MLDREKLRDLSPAEALDAAQELMVAKQRIAADELLLAAHVGDLYAERTTPAASGVLSLDSERLVAHAGPGAPTVSEYAATELAASLSCTPTRAAELIGDALELRHRLPRLWARVLGELFTEEDGTTRRRRPVEAWRARAVAAETKQLPAHVAAWVDRMLDSQRIPNAVAPQLVDEALRRLDPEAHALREKVKLDGRGVWVDHDSRQGLTRRVGMVLDAPDAKVLDDTLDDLATVEAALGDTAPLQIRRAKAVGILLDPQLALDLLSGTLPATGTSVEPSASVEPVETTPRRRTAVLYVHLDTFGADRLPESGRIEGLGPVTAETIRDWLTRPGGPAADGITITPVLDLSRSDGVPRHDPPEWMREIVILRDPTCVFPDCCVSSRRADLDHIDGWGSRQARPPNEGRPPDRPPDKTTAECLAPLCRRHHRLKTFTGWTYRRNADGTYTWFDRWGRPLPGDSAG